MYATFMQDIQVYLLITIPAFFIAWGLCFAIDSMSQGTHANFSWKLIGHIVRGEKTSMKWKGNHVNAFIANHNGSSEVYAFFKPPMMLRWVLKYLDKKSINA